MLELNVRVTPERDRTGVAVLRDGSRVHKTAPVAASASPAIAARRGNPACDPLRAWGHPPFGRYRLLNHVQARYDLHGEYGTHLLLFEPESGQALEAESFGRLALLAYGGPAGRDGRLRRTQGGLRLTDSLLYAILEALRTSSELALVIAAYSAPSWWQFWKRADDTMPLSSTQPETLSSPADEASVLAELLMNPALVRRPRRRPDDSRDRDDDRDERRRSGSSDDSSSSGRERFEGKGGESAGGGASGGWDSAPGRGPGVDQAGRIVGGAAAAAGLAVLANEAAGAVSPDSGTAAGDSGDGSGSDSPTTTSTSY